MDKIKILEKDLETVRRMIDDLSKMESGTFKFPNGAGIDRTKTIKELLWLDFQLQSFLVVKNLEQEKNKTSEKKG